MQRDAINPADPLGVVRAVERYCELARIHPSTLCRRIGVGNAFYERLRSGKQCLPTTAARALEWMRDNPPADFLDRRTRAYRKGKAK